MTVITHINSTIRLFFKVSQKLGQTQIEAFCSIEEVGGKDADRGFFGVCTKIHIHNTVYSFIILKYAVQWR